METSARSPGRETHLKIIRQLLLLLLLLFILLVFLLFLIFLLILSFLLFLIFLPPFLGANESVQRQQVCPLTSEGLTDEKWIVGKRLAEENDDGITKQKDRSSDLLSVLVSKKDK